jgi:hypothetical protein
MNFYECYLEFLESEFFFLNKIDRYLQCCYGVLVKLHELNLEEALLNSA